MTYANSSPMVPADNTGTSGHAIIDRLPCHVAITETPHLSNKAQHCYLFQQGIPPELTRTGTAYG